jgi:uroporphyrinogen decarboxylase
VFPWHVKIAAAIHGHGKPAILHSCGNAAEIMADVIDDMKYDGKHSFEDAIEPVEDAYRRHARRIALLGGIDVDFICRSAPDAVHRRARAMLELTAGQGGYGLGTGNSVPEYVPTEGYCAMIWAALEAR